jgi:hypothetical protein
LCGIFKEETEVFSADLSLLGQTIPVAIASAVKGKDEVVNRFRLRRNLAQCDTSALERGSMDDPSS